MTWFSEASHELKRDMPVCTNSWQDLSKDAASQGSLEGTVMPAPRDFFCVWSREQGEVAGSGDGQVVQPWTYLVEQS